jgi:hypothetical protein
MKKIITYFAVFTIVIITSSCATVFSGTHQIVRIDSNPSGATVEVNGIDQGVTPVDISLKKGFSGQRLLLKKQGFEETVFVPTVKLNPVTFINVVALIGFGVDAATGAMMRYDQPVYMVPLIKKSVAVN